MRLQATVEPERRGRQPLPDKIVKLPNGRVRARRSYNDFVGSIHSRLVPTLRRFEERDARSSKDLPALRPIEGETRRPEPLLPLEGIETLVPKEREKRAETR